MLNTKTFANDLAYQTLYDQIVGLDLLPGARISVLKLSQQLGISRTPLQRACSKLAENGLLDVRPQNGSFVSLIDVQRVFESFYMRNLLEQAAVGHICVLPQAQRDDVLSELKRNVVNQELVLKEQRYKDYFDLDNEFHRFIFASAGMSHIQQAQDQISADQDRIRRLKVITQVRMEQSPSEHERIVTALADADVDAAKYQVFLHISKFAEDTDAIHEEFPEYFSNWLPHTNLSVEGKRQSYYDFDLI